jgi:hypothetical protein
MDIAILHNKIFLDPIMHLGVSHVRQCIRSLAIMAIMLDAFNAKCDNPSTHERP